MFATLTPEVPVHQVGWMQMTLSMVLVCHSGTSDFGSGPPWCKVCCWPYSLLLVLQFQAHFYPRSLVVVLEHRRCPPLWGVSRWIFSARLCFWIGNILDCCRLPIIFSRTVGKSLFFFPGSWLRVGFHGRWRFAWPWCCICTAVWALRGRYLWLVVQSVFLHVHFQYLNTQPLRDIAFVFVHLDPWPWFHLWDLLTDGWMVDCTGLLWTVSFLAEVCTSPFGSGGRFHSFSQIPSHL